jgi:hypothetical protein
VKCREVYDAILQDAFLFRPLHASRISSKVGDHLAKRVSEHESTAREEEVLRRIVSQMSISLPVDAAFPSSPEFTPNSFTGRR